MDQIAHFGFLWANRVEEVLVMPDAVRAYADRTLKRSDGGVIFARLRGSEKKRQHSAIDIWTVCARRKV